MGIEGGIRVGRVVATAAPLTRRFIAWLLDSAIVGIPATLGLNLASHGRPGAAVALLFVAIVAAVINDVALVVHSGQSIGRRLLSVRVVDGGTMAPPRVGEVLWRNIIAGSNFGFLWHPVTALPALALTVGPWPVINYAFAFSDRRWHRALSDRWSRTVVIDVRDDHLRSPSATP